MIGRGLRFAVAGTLAAACSVVVGCASTVPNQPSSQLPDPLAAGWNGEPVCKLLHEDAHQRALRCTFPPSVGHERHFHARHFGYVVAGGRMKITDASGTREVDVATGGHFSSDGIEWHEVLNVGDTTAVFLIVEPK